eukprot:3926276-Pleurochrysis_carterae.AAC.3
MVVNQHRQRMLEAAKTVVCEQAVLRYRNKSAGVRRLVKLALVRELPGVIGLGASGASVEAT